jgi:beta-glucosidase
VAVNVFVNDRALREIYLLPFQIAIADSQPGAIMSAYNRLNGRHLSESKDMLDGVLRKEWGWKGMIMSDWYAALGLGCSSADYYTGMAPIPQVMP